MAITALGGRDPRSWGALTVVAGIDAAVAEPTGTTAVAVGVVDTGVCPVDGELPAWARGRVEYEPEDIEADSDADVHRGHGMFISALILNEAPDATIHMRRAVDSTTEGVNEDIAVADAIRSLTGEVSLVNLSFSGNGEAQPPQVLKEALDALGRQCVVVCAAGNEATQRRAYPAGLRPANALMVSVGAADTTGRGAAPLVAHFSNFASGTVFAPGTHVVGPHPDGRTVARSGTSYAAALVTGRIAALACARGIDVREAAESLLSAPDRTIPVYTANGPEDAPYLDAGARVLSGDDLPGW